MISRLFSKINGALDAIQEFISKAHEINLSEASLNKFLAGDRSYMQELKKAGVRDFRLAVLEGYLSASGTFEENGIQGVFSLKLAPDVIVWDDTGHRICFKLVDQGVKFKKNMKGVVAIMANAVAGTFMGKDLFQKRLESILENDQVVIDFDRMDKRYAPIVDSFEITGLACETQKLVVMLKPRPKQALLHSGKLLAWWLQHQARVDEFKSNGKTDFKSGDDEPDGKTM